MKLLVLIFCVIAIFEFAFGDETSAEDGKNETTVETNSKDNITEKSSESDVEGSGSGVKDTKKSSSSSESAENATELNEVKADLTKVQLGEIPTTAEAVSNKSIESSGEDAQEIPEEFY
ncbi:hypothetical protein WR25_01654 [Diploscapter pachys]|uniref:Uncharacterized protein n=1 Tax=Diploscapter pachys TaxID=2018661 RepID=A0A2A2JSC2_9BILA|nr:hypothetical protein WR25_01654 [Diploscapter pachys]